MSNNLREKLKVLQAQIVELKEAEGKIRKVRQDMESEAREMGIRLL